MRNIIEFYQNHKATIVALILVVTLFTVYPPIFRNIYNSGRDFGRSIVNALIP